MKALADLLVVIAVRELKTIHARNENAPTVLQTRLSGRHGVQDDDKEPTIATQVHRRAL